MFADDMTAQMQRMTDVLLATLAVLHDDATVPTPRSDDLAEQPALERSLHELGALHRDRWNVQPEHYLYIAHALTRAVRDVAGPCLVGLAELELDRADPMDHRPHARRPPQLASTLSAHTR